jgi:hypothetical protein
MKKFFLVVVCFTLGIRSYAQKQDTVIINLAKTSKIIFTVEDPDDLEILKHYDFQQLFEDILHKIEEKKKVNETADSTTVANEDQPSTEPDNDVIIEDEEVRNDQETQDDETVYRREEREGDEDDDNDDDDFDWRGHKKWNRTWQAFNFDLGTNNYLHKDKFPGDEQAFAVRPWGSWYIGGSSVQRSRIARKFFLEWGMGMSWYTFKFQDNNTLIVKNDNGVEFTTDVRDVDFRKSKLSITYIQVSLIPVLDFGDHGRKARFWDGYNDHSFRIGFGPYLGYRIGSHSKIVYEDGGREKDKNRDGFYLNNVRYGARLQLGYRSTDLFFNYDMNELFQENKGPKLNAFSFGVIF